MRTFFILAFLFIGLTPPQTNSFKQNQLRYARVRNAYTEKEQSLQIALNKLQLSLNQVEIYIRAFKAEKELEIWVRKKGSSHFQLFKTYPICAISGETGPKRQRGDGQIPEGFYHIDRFNPVSNFHLSLGINYPNKSDRILGNKAHLGGDIFIHGACVTVGCLPMTDDLIREIYVLSVEAKNNGQKTIPVTIFPAKLSAHQLNQLIEKHSPKPEVEHLWTSLQHAYVSFNKNKQLPNITFLPNGQHNVH